MLMLERTRVSQNQPRSCSLPIFGDRGDRPARAADTPHPGLFISLSEHGFSDVRHRVCGARKREGKNGLCEYITRNGDGAHRAGGRNCITNPNTPGGSGTAYDELYSDRGVEGAVESYFHAHFAGKRGGAVPTGRRTAGDLSDRARQGGPASGLWPAN